MSSCAFLLLEVLLLLLNLQKAWISFEQSANLVALCHSVSLSLPLSIPPLSSPKLLFLLQQEEGGNLDSGTL